MQTPKLRIGKSFGKREKIDLSHDVNTTADFGFCQPLMCKELIPNTKGVMDVKSFVRLAPMPAPTFGRVRYNMYHYFVPTSTVYAPYENLISATTFSSSEYSYIPDQVPCIRLRDLSKCLLKYSSFNRFKGPYYSIGFATESISYQGTGNNVLSDVYYNGYDDYWLPSLGVFDDMTSLYEEHGATPTSADYVLYQHDDGENTLFFYCFQLTNAGRRLRKILLGLGYQLNVNAETNVYVSLLPLFAYYKAWYDLFAPQQDTNYMSTNAYKLQQVIEHENHTNLSQDFWFNNEYWKGFLEDLTYCYYTSSDDYVSMHIPTPQVNQTGTIIKNNYFSGLSESYDVMSSSYTNAVSTISDLGMQSSTISLLQKLQTFLTKNTIIGGKIAQYLRVHFGADYQQNLKSCYIGSDSVMVDIGDVMATAETNEGSLGEYAGRGVAVGNGKQLTYETDSFGFWITFGVIVPIGGYCQGVDPNLMHLNRFEQFTPEFDALGYQITDCASVYNSDCPKYNKDYSGSFGFVPRYSEYKIAPNILNGDLSRRQTRDSLSCYTLDRWLTGNDYTIVADDDSDISQNKTYTCYLNNESLPIASTSWRYIGRYSWLGNYNRIFYNYNWFGDNISPKYDGSRQSVGSLLMDDNFICHHYFDFQIYSPMKSLSDSYDTDSSNENGIGSIQTDMN